VKNIQIAKLVQSFQQKSPISREDLYNYFIQEEGELNEGTFGWRIYDLKQKGILREVRTGWYTLNAKPLYIPTPDKRILKIDKIIKSNFQETQYCIWNLDWLNEFTRHQFARDTFIVEIEKDVRETAGLILRQNGFKDTLLWLPNLPLAFADAVNPIFLISLISRSPVQQVPAGTNRYVPCPTLEKILVDIFEENTIFHFLQGAELKYIFEQAFARYAINFSTLFGYAGRRNKTMILRDFLEKHFSYLL
jgi:hypothetical protein